MPQPELSHRYQKAVLWPRTGTNIFGQPVVGPPVELSVRWDDSHTVTLDHQGSPISIDATAFLDRDVDIGSVMWLGSLDDLMLQGPVRDAGNLQPPMDAMEVKMFTRTPDIRNRISARKASLMRLKDTLPERVSGVT